MPADRLRPAPGITGFSGPLLSLILLLAVWIIASAFAQSDLLPGPGAVWEAVQPMPWH